MPTSAPLPSSYEQAETELETLIQQMQSGHVSLSDLLHHYERGAQLLAYCRTQLQTVEQAIHQIDEQGFLSQDSPSI